TAKAVPTKHPASAAPTGKNVCKLFQRFAVGRTPTSARVPQDPPSRSATDSHQAGEGAGRRPGGLPRGLPPLAAVLYLYGMAAVGIALPGALPAAGSFYASLTA